MHFESGKVCNLQASTVGLLVYKSRFYQIELNIPVIRFRLFSPVCIMLLFANQHHSVIGPIQ